MLTQRLLLCDMGLDGVRHSPGRQDTLEVCLSVISLVEQVEALELPVDRLHCQV